MGGRAAATTLANTSTSTVPAPARQECPRAGLDGRSRRQHIIDEDETGSVGRGFAVIGHGERALDIGGALDMRQSTCCCVARVRFSAP
jgi:hypothetical protein